MSLSLQEERILDRTENALRASAPDLAARLTAFCIFSQDAPMPRRERLHGRMPWLIRLLAKAARWLGLVLESTGPVYGYVFLGADTTWEAGDGMGPPHRRGHR